MKAACLILICFFVSSCATKGLETQCQNADEIALGETYAQHKVPPRNFDVFANQCAKYGFRVPSKEKFLEGYGLSTADMCANSKKYFKASYKRFSLGHSAEDCSPSSIVESFNVKEVKEDAFQAHLLTSSIKDLDAKIDKAEDNRAKTYDKDLVIDALARAAFEDNPVSLKTNRDEKSEELKAVIKKYGLYISDLGTI
jgi:hypothetical protein